MKLSTKTRYGTRILIELTLHQGMGAVQVSKIAANQKIPVKYLEQILRKLKIAGFVKSVRGPKGGHLIARDPKDISLGEVVRFFEEQTDLVECVSSPDKCDRSPQCRVRNAWLDATSVLYDRLDGISIAELAQDQGAADGCCH